MRIMIEMEKNAGLQVHDGTESLDLGNGRRFSSADLGDFAGAFLNGRNRLQTRIDATQHCLSALLRTRTVL